MKKWTWQWLVLLAIIYLTFTFTTAMLATPYEPEELTRPTDPWQRMIWECNIEAPWPYG